MLTAIFVQLPFHKRTSTNSQTITVSKTPEPTLQPINFVASFTTIFPDQSWLLNTKGLFVINANITAAAQAMILLNTADHFSQLYNGK